MTFFILFIGNMTKPLVVGEGELKAILDSPQDWGITEFATHDPSRHGGFDLNYWPDGVAVLFQGEIVKPVAAPAYRLP